jgi:hypothetical protein
MKTYGLTDGIDFLAALGSASDEDEELQNALIVHTIEAWRHLSTSREPLVLIAAPALELGATDTAGAVAAGHHVFVSGTRGIAGQGAAVTLSRQDHYAIAQALQESGYSEARAMALSRACCGRSGILKRLVTRHPETRFPAWGRDECRTQLAPFALLGGWMHVDPEPHNDADAPRIGAPPPLDLWLVTELVGCTREELDALVIRWQRDSEPLFLQFGRSVLVASREDAWHLLGGSVTEQQLQRFRNLALLVLEEDNPAFELAPDQRWLANLYGKTHTLSDELRRSIVETRIDGKRCYFTADNWFHQDQFSGSGGWMGLNRSFPQLYAASARKVLDAAPDWVVAEHGGAFEFNAEDFRRRVRWGRVSAAAADAICVSGHHRRDWNPHRVHVKPLVQKARPGATLQALLVASNPLAHRVKIAVTLDGRRLTKDQTWELDLAGRSEARCKITVRLGSDIPAGRHVFALQVREGDTLDGCDAFMAVDVKP